MHLDTDYRLNFLRPKYTKTQVARMPSEIVRSTAPMDHTSNYKDAYVVKHGERVCMVHEVGVMVVVHAVGVVRVVAGVRVTCNLVVYALYQLHKYNQAR